MVFRARLWYDVHYSWGGPAAWVMGKHQKRLWGRGWQSRVDVFEIVLGLLVAVAVLDEEAG